MLRFLEKVRYKWRRRKALVRFVVLMLDGIWRERTAPRATMSDPSKPTGSGNPEGVKGKRRSAA
jgi:hypothetical protein